MSARKESVVRCSSRGRMGEYSSSFNDRFNNHGKKLFGDRIILRDLIYVII
jgi:hypothetical protein